jgi:hypothetical protein
MFPKFVCFLCGIIERIESIPCIIGTNLVKKIELPNVGGIVPGLCKKKPPLQAGFVIGLI